MGELINQYIKDINKVTLPNELIKELLEARGDTKVWSLRKAYGVTLSWLGRNDSRVVVLDADLAESTMTKTFRDYKGPDGAYLLRHRFFEMGIAEQSMMATAGGLAIAGLTPFLSSYAQFLASRSLDQARNTVDYTNLNVKVAAAHGALSVGEDGPSHQSMEDIANMKTLVNFQVVVPCDPWECARVVVWASQHQGPVYFRMPRSDLPEITKEDDCFEIGKPVVLREGTDGTIFATGVMVGFALKAADILAENGLNTRVVNIHTIKPIDKDFVIECANETKYFVTAEEHSIHGGLGSEIAMIVASNTPKTPVTNIAIMNQYLTSGPWQHLFEIAGLTAENIVTKLYQAKELSE